MGQSKGERNPGHAALSFANDSLSARQQAEARAAANACLTAQRKTPLRSREPSAERLNRAVGPSSASCGSQKFWNPKAGTEGIIGNQSSTIDQLAAFRAALSEFGLGSAHERDVLPACADRSRRSAHGQPAHVGGPRDSGAGEVAQAHRPAVRGAALQQEQRRQPPVPSRFARGESLRLQCGHFEHQVVLHLAVLGVVDLREIAAGQAEVVPVVEGEQEGAPVDRRKPLERPAPLPVPEREIQVDPDRVARLPPPSKGRVRAGAADRSLALVDADPGVP